MNHKTTYLLGILTTLIVGAFLQWFFCCTCSAIEQKPEISVAHTTVSEPFSNGVPFSFSDENISIKSQDNLNFFKSGHDIIEPVSNHLKSCLKELASHFMNNPNKTLKITGLYLDQEENLSKENNLGFARAWAIKDYLKLMGVPDNQIQINGKTNNDLKVSAKNVLFGPYEFETINKENNNSELLSLKNEALKHSVLVNFLPGQSKKILTKEERDRLYVVAKFLNASESATCSIVGHTDSVKSEESNLILAEERAKFTKAELIKLNVDPKKVKILSKGESSPLDSNSTKRGRAINRRTEVQFN